MRVYTAAMSPPSDLLRKKLGMKPEARVHLVDAPAELRTALGAPKAATRLSGRFDHLQVFVTDAQALEAAFERLKPHLDAAGALWVSWPKAGGLGTALTLQKIIRIGYDHGLVESKTIGLDATWSAIKFTFPKPGKSYRNSYGRLPSADA
jgi:hypothetical protein